MLARLPFPTRRENQTTKLTLVDMLSRSDHEAMAYVDPMGGRLAGALHGSRLADDLTLPTPVAGTHDSTLIRSSSTGNASIHTLSGSKPVFTHVCAATSPLLAVLTERIRNTPTGQSGAGRTLIIRRAGDVEYSGVEADTLFDRMRRVYSQGAREPEHLTRVVFSEDSADDWKAFLSSDAQALLGRGEPLTDWEQEQLRGAPATPELCAGMAARAAMTMAFMEALGEQKSGPLAVVTLTDKHLALARDFAWLAYTYSSGATAIEQRLSNLGSGAEHYLSDKRVSAALEAFREAVAKAESGRITRTSVKRVPGLTHGTLDELVRRGDIVERRGVGDKRSGGKRQRSYELATCAGTNDPEVAHRPDPGAFMQREALLAYWSTERLPG